MSAKKIVEKMRKELASGALVVGALWAPAIQADIGKCPPKIKESVRQFQIQKTSPCHGWLTPKINGVMTPSWSRLDMQQHPELLTQISSLTSPHYSEAQLLKISKFAESNFDIDNDGQKEQLIAMWGNCDSRPKYFTLGARIYVVSMDGKISSQYADLRGIFSPIRIRGRTWLIEGATNVEKNELKPLFYEVREPVMHRNGSNHFFNLYPRICVISKEK